MRSAWLVHRVVIHLQVRLRQEGLPLPGSPFDLTVAAGPADGHATFMKAAFKPVGKPADRVLRGKPTPTPTIPWPL